MATIAFLHSLSNAEQQQWLARFKELLPGETVLPIEQISQQQALDVDIAIVANPDPTQLVNFPNLVWIHSLWAGVEALVESFQRLDKTQSQQLQQVKLVRLIDPQLAQSMSQAALTWVLYLYRNIPEYAAQQRNKVWRAIAYKNIDTVRVSVLGAGELGLAACEVLRGQGFKVNCWSRSAKSIDGVRHFSTLEQLPEMLKETDILLCLLPLTPETRGLLNQQMLLNLPAGAKLINFARGPIVNIDDLVKLLDEGHLSHGVLDVFEREPLPVDSVLWQHSKISILPHISATTNLHSAAKVVAGNIMDYRTTAVIPEAVDFTRGY